MIADSVKVCTPNRCKGIIVAKCHRKNPVPCWDYECYNIKKQRRLAFRKWEHSL